MTKNRILFWIFTLLASVAIVLGFCLLFLGTKDVDAMPKAVSIENIDGEHYLSTDYNSEYYYQFRLEQQIDSEFILINTIDSKTNSIKLKRDDFDIIAGQKYRFSARYITENGSGDGLFCESLIWQPSFKLNKVKDVAFDLASNTLSWSKSYSADYYKIKIVDENANVMTTATTEINLDLSRFDVGSYKVYVSACSNNEYLFDSVASEALEISLIRKNVILSAVYDQNLIVRCKELVQQFSIVDNDVQIAIITPDEVLGQIGNYTYKFKKAEFYMQGLTNAKIKSLGEEFVLESDFYNIVFQ